MFSCEQFLGHLQRLIGVHCGIEINLKIFNPRHAFVLFFHFEVEVDLIGLLMKCNKAHTDPLIEHLVAVHKMHQNCLYLAEFVSSCIGRGVHNNPDICRILTFGDVC